MEVWRFLTDDQIDLSAQPYREFQDVEGFCRVASTEEIKVKGSNLSIRLYVRWTGETRKADDGESGGSLEDAIEAWQQNSAALRQSTSRLLSELSDVRA